MGGFWLGGLVWGGDQDVSEKFAGYVPGSMSGWM